VSPLSEPMKDSNERSVFPADSCGERGASEGPPGGVREATGEGLCGRGAGAAERSGERRGGEGLGGWKDAGGGGPGGSVFLRASPPAPHAVRKAERRRENCQATPANRPVTRLRWAARTRGRVDAGGQGGGDGQSGKGLGDAGEQDEEEADAEGGGLQVAAGGAEPGEARDHEAGQQGRQRHHGRAEADGCSDHAKRGERAERRGGHVGSVRLRWVGVSGALRWGRTGRPFCPDALGPPWPLSGPTGASSCPGPLPLRPRGLGATDSAHPKRRLGRARAGGPEGGTWRGREPEAAGGVGGRQGGARPGRAAGAGGGGRGQRADGLPSRPSLIFLYFRARRTSRRERSHARTAGPPPVPGSPASLPF
jgi:hypothetical protein